MFDAKHLVAKLLNFFCKFCIIKAFFRYDHSLLLRMGRSDFLHLDIISYHVVHMRLAHTTHHTIDFCNNLFHFVFLLKLHEFI